jgi:hypothetical protein
LQLNYYADLLTPVQVGRFLPGVFPDFPPATFGLFFNLSPLGQKKMLKLVVVVAAVTSSLVEAQLTGTQKTNVELDMKLSVCTGSMNCVTGLHPR